MLTYRLNIARSVLPTQAQCKRIQVCNQHNMIRSCQTFRCCMCLQLNLQITKKRNEKMKMRNEFAELNLYKVKSKR